jgi:hypothetical protein
MTAIEEIHSLTKQVASLKAELAALKAGAPAKATAQASTPSSGTFTNRADCERAYLAIQGEGLALAKAKAVFREKHKAVLGIL